MILARRIIVNEQQPEITPKPLTHAEYMAELWHRVEMEQLLGYDVCKRLNLDQASYMINNPRPERTAE